MTRDIQEFNDLSRQSLLALVLRNRARHDLLVLDRSLSPYLNRLCQFLRIKEAARIDKVVWLDEVAKNGLPPLADTHLLLVLMNLTTLNFSFIDSVLEKSSDRATLIVRNASSEMIYKFCQKFNAKHITFNSLLTTTSSAWQVLPRLKVCKWETSLPLLVEGGDFLLSLLEQNGGITDYFERPLYVVEGLSKAVLSVLFADPVRPMKLRNCYAKGDHAALVVNTIQETLVPHHLSNVMDSAQADFYREKLAGLVDLVVLDRNLDYTPCLFDQTTYHGVLDDFFGIDLDQLNTKPFAEAIDPLMVGDTTYEECLKHLNFAGVGPYLNQKAKQVQNQFSDAAAQGDSITEIQKMVADLGQLTALQESVKRHTTISARILQDIDAEYEALLLFQNDIWDTEYRTQINTVQSFIAMRYDVCRVLAAICLTSIIHDGLATLDVDAISSLILDMYGLEAVFVLEQLREKFLIRIAEKTDFLSSFIPTSASNAAPEPEDAKKNLGITGALDTLISKHTLISKFWNLHPVEEHATPSSPENMLSILNALPGNTVPLLYRLVEALFFREFLTYKPINNIKRRPNWDNLGVDLMFAGTTLDINNDDRRDQPRRGDGPIPPSLKLLVVVVVGGVTRSELTCFQHFKKRLREQHKHENMIVISNGILNRARLFDHLKSGS